MPFRTVEVSEEMDSFIKSSVSSGTYKSADAIIESALTLLSEEEENDSYKLFALRQAIQKGVDSGLAEGGTEEVFARVRARAGLPARARV